MASSATAVKDLTISFRCSSVGSDGSEEYELGLATSLICIDRSLLRKTLTCSRSREASDVPGSRVLEGTTEKGSNGKHSKLQHA